MRAIRWTQEAASATSGRGARVGRARLGGSRAALATALATALALPAGAAGDEDAALTALLLPGPGATVEAASRREQTLAEAPSVVTVYTREDIEQLGLRTVHDALRITPGFTIVQDLDDVVVGARGIVSDNNSKFVILINGHNVTSFLNLGINPNDAFPMSLENVRRIEILHGPGSAMWGSGALLGVINLVIEDGTTFEGTRVGGGFGNRDTLRAHAQHGTLFGDEGSAFVSAKLYQSRGTDVDKHHFTRQSEDSDGDGINDVPFVPATELYGAGPSYELYGDFGYGNLGLTLRALELRDRDGLDNPPNAWDQRSDYGELRYEDRWMDDLRVRVALFADHWRQKAKTRIVDEILDFHEVRYGAQLLADYEPAPEHRFSLGGDVKRTHFDDTSDVRTTTGRRFDAFDDTEGDVFAQYQWSPAGWLTLLGAVRYTASDSFDSSVDPKAMVRIHPADDLSLKYLYQTAFLHPSAFQRNAFIRPGRAPNPEELEAMQRQIDNEQAKSHELQLLWSPHERVQLSATGFYSRLEEVINFNGNPETVSAGTFVNFGDVETYGVELGGTFRWWKLRHDLNVSFAEAELETKEFGLLTMAEADGDLLGYPDVMANVVTRFLATEDFSIAAIVRILGPTEHFETDLDRVARDAGPTDTAVLVDLHVRHENVGTEGLTLELTVINALDDETRQPLSANSGTVRPEALSVYANASYRF